METEIIQPSNVAPRTTEVNAQGNRTLTGNGYTLPYLPIVAMNTAEPMFYNTAFPLQFALITAATAVTTVAQQMQVSGRNLHAIAVSGTFVGTVTVYGTLDGTNWVTLDSVTAPEILQYAGLYQDIAVSVTAYTSGSITVTGMTQRT